MIKEGNYPLHIRHLIALSPKGVLGPWARYAVADFYAITQSHLPQGISWHPIERVLSLPAMSNHNELNQHLQSSGVMPENIRLNIQAYENLRRIFAVLNGFDYVPLPSGGKVLPGSLEIDWQGQHKRTKIRPFYEICFCGSCTTTRYEVERQKRVAAGEEEDDHDNDDDGF